MSKAVIVSPPNEFSSLLATVLEYQGHDVCAFDCSAMQDCVDQVSRNAPDVVIVDVGVPLPMMRSDLRGWECLLEIKANEATCNLPIIAYSVIIDELQEILTSLKDLRIPVVRNPGEVDDFVILIERIRETQSVAPAA